MNDLRKTIVPKSDQMNADDLIAGPITITITKVSVSLESEQPASLFFEGDGGKPFKPCKSMRRVLVIAWGPDANTFVGRSLTLYREPGVRFGGMAVGGIRISHMSHIDKPITMALMETKAKRAPFTVKPLAQTPPSTGRDLPSEADAAANAGSDAYKAFWLSLDPTQREWLKPAHEARKATAKAIDDAQATPTGDTP